MSNECNELAARIRTLERELELQRKLTAAYKRMAEARSMGAVGMLGAAHVEIQRLESGQDGVETERDILRRELAWLKEKTEEILDRINQILG